jgi:anaerobic magnesium-protoporphyrin IX monomethyl ester cyclase
MRILLATPKPADAFIPYGPPIGLCYLSSFLKQHGHGEVRGVDLNVQPLEDFAAALEDADLVGLYASTKSIKPAWELARLAKARGCTVVLGGPHPTLCPDETLAEAAVDFAVRGEGESTLLELVRLLEAGTGEAAAIDGLSYRSAGDGSIVHTRERRVFSQLDDLPFPDLSLFDLGRYPSIDLSVAATRGCPYRCTNCQPALDKLCGRFRTRTVENVIAEIESLRRHPVWCGHVHFVDNDLTINRRWITQFCNEVIGRGLRIRWACEGRANTLDRELLGLMKRAGCRMVGMGVESGSDRVLREIIRKGITRRQALDVVTWAREVGIDVHCWFIIGIPGETLEEMRETIALAASLEATSIGFSIGTPWPGTGFHAVSREKGYLLSSDWEDYNEKGVSRLRTEAFGPEDVETVRQEILRVFAAKGWRANVPTFVIRNLNYRTTVLARSSYKIQSLGYKWLGHERMIRLRRRVNRTRALAARAAALA